MKKKLILLVIAVAMGIGGSAHSDGINHHGVDMQDLVAIHYQLSEIDKKLSKDPDNPELNNELEQLEKDLTFKLRKYNKMIAEINKKRTQALETIPAAGKSN